MLVHLKLFVGRFDQRALLACRSAHDGHDDANALHHRHAHLGATPLPPKPPVDPFFFDHSSEDDGDDGMWIDFMADCGDGFDSSYEIARLLAQPKLKVSTSQKLWRSYDQKGRSEARGRTLKQGSLPRGKLLVIGGDLAYPHPSTETFEARFIRPFTDAMASPPHFDPMGVATHKPDIPKDMTLQEWPGPLAYIVPGNHVRVSYSGTIYYVPSPSPLGAVCVHERTISAPPHILLLSLITIDALSYH